MFFVIVISFFVVFCHVLVPFFAIWGCRFLSIVCFFCNLSFFVVFCHVPFFVIWGCRFLSFVYYFSVMYCFLCSPDQPVICGRAWRCREKKTKTTFPWVICFVIFVFSLFYFFVFVVQIIVLFWAQGICRTQNWQNKIKQNKTHTETCHTQMTKKNDTWQTQTTRNMTKMTEQ